MYRASIMLSQDHHVDTIAEALHRLFRQISRRKAALATDPQHTEWAAHQLLEQISGNESVRAVYLAECLAADPSTISRHVAALVKAGLVERRPDPEDGRASLLACTAAGQHLVERHRAQRRDALRTLLSEFSADELSALSNLLPRFAACIEEQPAGPPSPNSPEHTAPPASAAAHPATPSPVPAASEGHR